MKESKIKLKNAEVLENQEMKMIFGGSGSNMAYAHVQTVSENGVHTQERVDLPTVEVAQQIAILFNAY